MRAILLVIGLMLLQVALIKVVVGGGAATTGQIPSLPQVQPSQPGAPTSASLISKDIPLGQAVNEAVKWCAPSCNPTQFYPLPETGGFINPEGLKFRGGGQCYPFSIPAGIQYDYWDSFKVSSGNGPVNLPRVCEASFRGRIAR